MLIMLVGIIVSIYYSDDIKNYVINSLNKELNVKVEVETADVSALKKFPYISMALGNVVAYSSKGIAITDFPEIQTDTLFKAKNIFLRFNIIDIIRGNYNIKRIIAEDGELTLLSDSRGVINYKLFRESLNKEKVELSVELELFKLKNFKYIFSNIHKNINTSGIVEDVILKGKFGQKNFTLSLIGNVLIENLSREGILWVENTKLSSRISLNASDTIFTINKGDISLNGLKLGVKGMLTTGERLVADLYIDGEGLLIRDVMRTIPDNMNKFSAGYSADGRADIHVRLAGEISSLDIPEITAEYKVNHGRLKVPDIKSTITNINFNGFFSNGSLHSAKTSSFRFENVTATLGNSGIKGTFSIENLISPTINLSFKGEMYATDINSLITSQNFLFTKGVISSDFQVSTSFLSFKDFDIRRMLSSSTAGELFFRDLGVRLGDYYPEITKLDGNTKITNDNWLTELDIETSSGDMRFSGSIDHIIKHFIHKSSSLWIQGSIYSHYADLSFLLSPEAKDDSSGTSFLLPDKLFMKLDLSLDKLNLSKFNASDVSAILSYRAGFLNFSSFQLSTMRGSINGFGGLIQDASGNISLKTSSQLNQLDIKELFEVFNNFRQEFITYKNLGGRISGLWELSTSLSSNLDPDLKSIWSEADVVIENGELKDFEPLKNLSRFIEVSELEHVKFKTLQNKFIVKDSKVYVPKMDINSTAFNISAKGTHSFENYFEYNVKVNLSEILANKARKKKENDEFAIHEKSGQRVNLFLTITGTPDDFKIKYDRSGSILQIKNDIKAEKKVLKTILHEEFGLFKKQMSDSITKVKKDTPPKFIFEWDEKDDMNNSESPQEKKTKEPIKKSGELKFDWLN